jgi:hypothetical protein
VVDAVPTGSSDQQQQRPDADRRLQLEAVLLDNTPFKNERVVSEAPIMSSTTSADTIVVAARLG